MLNINKHLISFQEPISNALDRLNQLGGDLTLFVIDENNKLIGTLTDGDSRRGFLNGLNINEPVHKFMKLQFKYIRDNDYFIQAITDAKNSGIQILPVVDENMSIVRLINFSEHKSYLPLSVVIMAGGEGIRLRPLTEKTPKPMLLVGDKPILEYCIDLIVKFGINDVAISINYLGDVIKNYFQDGRSKGISISYLEETSMLGTIGSVTLVGNIKHDNILVLNSDLLTNIDLEDFYYQHVNNNADISVASVPSHVSVPYAVLDIENDNIIGLREKPTYTYNTNAGIYILKKECLNYIPKNSVFNATDLIELLINKKKKVIYYPFLGYWLDIGRMDDFILAQRQIKYIKL